MHVADPLVLRPPRLSAVGSLADPANSSNTDWLPCIQYRDGRLQPRHLLGQCCGEPIDRGLWGRGGPRNLPRQAVGFVAHRVFRSFDWDLDPVQVDVRADPHRCAFRSSTVGACCPAEASPSHLGARVAAAWIAEDAERGTSVAAAPPLVHDPFG